MPINYRRGPPGPPRGYMLDVVPVTASLTVSGNYCDAMLRSDAASDITLTLPNDAPVGFNFSVEQAGTGLVILATATGATKFNRQSFDRTAGQYAVMGAFVDSNPTGLSANWILIGDGDTA